MASPIKKFRLELENEAKMSSKRVKMGGTLILCWLLLNFVLVAVVMNRTSGLSSPISTTNFSVWVNQTHETGKLVDEMKFDLDGIENWINSTEEKFESHQLQIGLLSNQTKIKKLKALENENKKLKKSHEELKEQFESLGQKSRQLLDPQWIQSCRDALEILQSPRPQKQWIYPHGNGSSRRLEVLCDFDVDGGGWTIIQKRTSGPREEFNRTWNEYAEGFGSLSGNFWLGLENIHTLTKNRDQELRIELEDFEGSKAYAKYANFSISDASDFYRLSLGGFYGNSTAGDSMTEEEDGNSNKHNGMRFSTKDKDNDNYSSGNCVHTFGGGGWWFNNCGYSNLNGFYIEKGEMSQSPKGTFWASWQGHSYSLAKTEMKIRRRQ